MVKMLKTLTRLVCICILFLVGVTAYAQVNTDSLYGVWKDKTQVDSTRAKAYSDYIFYKHNDSHPDSLIAHGRELYRFTVDKDYDKGTVDVLNMMGYAFFNSGQYPQALASYKEGLEIAKRINDKNGMADILLRTGFIYHDNGDLIKAIDYYQRSEAIFLELKAEDGLGSIYNEFGSIYKEQEDYAKSHEYYEKSLAICEKREGNSHCSAQYNNIGSLLFDQEKYVEARSYFQKSLTICENNNDQMGISSALAGIGNTYSAAGNLDKAFEYLDKARILAVEIDNVQGQAKNLLDLAEIFIKQKSFRKALRYSDQSLYLSKSLNDLNDQMEAYECLYESFKGLGNTRKALEYFELSQTIRDSLNASNTAKKLQNIEFQKRVTADSLLQVERDLKVEMAHRTEVRGKEKNRNIAIGAGLFFLLLAGGFYGRWRYVKKSKAIIEKEKDRSDNLLLNILPSEIAEELKIKGKADARDFDLVSILFTDFKGFTKVSEKLSAQELLQEINHCFKAFDHICGKFGIEKIKTIGDAYMAAGGLPVPSDTSVKNTVLAALEMQHFISERIIEKHALNETPFEMRLGIHSGPVVAGIVGVKKFQYDIWGDTVNTASRIESSGEIGKVNISQSTFELLKNDPDFSFEHRGKIEAKGKGEIDMYFVSKIS